MLNNKKKEKKMYLFFPKEVGWDEKLHCQTPIGVGN